MLSPQPSALSPAPLRIVVLASGAGRTFDALAGAQQNGFLPVDIRVVLSDRRLAPVLELAETRGIHAEALRAREFPDRLAFDRALFARAASYDPQLIVLAGYMRVIDATVVAEWQGRMINLHPSLLPKYPGLDTYARALAAGDKTYGSSVHYVTDKLDGGPVISQASLPVLEGDTLDALTERLRPVEQALLIATLGLIARQRIALGSNGVELDGRPLLAPLPMSPGGGFTGL
jgi:phosphoribosylglycinamide formyltransferase-1